MDDGQIGRIITKLTGDDNDVDDGEEVNGWMECVCQMELRSRRRFLQL
jgi:hypothetical protein